MRNSAEYVSLKFRQLACTFWCWKFPHQMPETTGIFTGRRQKVTTKDLHSHQPTGESTLISSRDWRSACSLVYFVVRSFNREANPNDDTRSSRPGSSGNRVLDLGHGIAAGCLSKHPPPAGAFGIVSIGSASPATRRRPSQGIQRQDLEK